MRRPGLALLVGAAVAAASPAPAAQDPAAEGGRHFRARCASCHGTAEGQNRVGPHLAGVVGREAGSVEGARYSAALKESGIVWDPVTLEAFLANPRKAVPGTTMAVGLTDADQRTQVIEYLRTLSDGG